MESKQLYIFVDKTGRCFDALERKMQKQSQGYFFGVIVQWLKNGKHFSEVGKQACIEALVDRGFVYSKDFYVRKVL